MRWFILFIVAALTVAFIADANRSARRQKDGAPALDFDPYSDVGRNLRGTNSGPWTEYQDARISSRGADTNTAPQVRQREPIDTTNPYVGPSTNPYIGAARNDTAHADGNYGEQRAIEPMQSRHSYDYETVSTPAAPVSAAAYADYRGRVQSDALPLGPNLYKDRSTGEVRNTYDRGDGVQQAYRKPIDAYNEMGRAYEDWP